MTLDDLIPASRAPAKLQRFIDCYKIAQARDCVALRSALPMRDFAPLMANIALMDIQGPENIIYRIVGENIIERLGFNPTGHNMVEILAPEFREQVPQLNALMVNHPCGYYGVYESQYESGRSMMTESTAFPMREDGKSRINLVLAYHIHHEATGLTRSKGETLLATHLETSRLIDIGRGLPDENAPAPLAPGKVLNTSG